jgi:hypothetical protein
MAPTANDIRFQVEMLHGPADVLGRYILLSHSVGIANGIRLSIEPIELLSDINRANRSSWNPLFPGLDVRCSNIGAHNAFCVIGRNPDGDIVATQGCRLYDFTATTFTEAAEDMTFWFSDPRSCLADGDHCTVHAWSGRNITGRAVYSGATWVRPDYRGKRMVQIMPRLVRAVGTAKWGPDATFGIMAESLVKGGLLLHNGFRNHEWSVELTSRSIGNYRFKLLWEKPADLVEDLLEFLNGTPSEALQAQPARHAQQKLRAV